MSAGYDETEVAGETPGNVRGRSELSAGQRVAGRYQVEELIGRGGMGAVYRVHDSTLDEVVALKLLTLSAEAAVEGFLREVRLSRRVTHPNVARTYDFGEHDGVRYLTMEYVRGTSLDRLLASSPRIAPARAAGIADQIAAGLEAAHDAGIVHRDLKPANVLLGDRGRVVLTDFGIARAVGVGGGAQVTAAVVGTPRYMSPEQAAARPADSRSDMYALGLILFEMLTGRAPFEADDPLAEAVARVERDAPDPRGVAEVPDPLAELIARCLSRDPGGRPQTAGDVRAALSTAVSEAGVGFAHPVGREPSPPTAPTPTGEHYASLCQYSRALAVLPFLYRGAPDHDYLGEALAEELIDLLTRTRGLRVLAPGATRRFAGDRDPARVGEQLGADVVVEGTVQFSGDRVRLSARLVEAESGVQRWSERFDGRFEDVFSLQESLGRRVAESLRLELDAAAHRRTAPHEALDLYLRARRMLRGDVNVQASEALTMLERCLELAPRFSPALPAHAIASVRAWWELSDTPVAERAQRAQQSVARARDEAPDVADTHLAIAMLAVQTGAFSEAAPALAKALEIAPTLAEAHQYLGQLQAEAGHVDEGRRRLELALELDPTLHVCRFALVRLTTFAGELDTALEHLRLLERAKPASMIALKTLALRFALWRGRRADIEAAFDAMSALEGERAQLLCRMVEIAVGRGSADGAREALATIKDWLGNDRFAGLMQQFAVEALCSAGEHDAAAEILAAAAAGALVDLDWMRRCPLLEPLRATDAYAGALAAVQARAYEIWAR